MIIKWMSLPPRSRNRALAPQKTAQFSVPSNTYPFPSLEITNHSPGLYGNYCLAFICIATYVYINKQFSFPCFWIESYCTYFLSCFSCTFHVVFVDLVHFYCCYSVQIDHKLSILLLLDIWDVSIFGLLGAMLLWIFLNILVQYLHSRVYT